MNIQSCQWFYKKYDGNFPQYFGCRKYFVSFEATPDGTPSINRARSAVNLFVL